MKTRTKKIFWGSLGGLVVLGVGATIWMYYAYRYTPVEVVMDVKAGIAARHAPKPVERFLEIRYGPLTDPANRQQAFLDFFNLGHIQGLELITSHMREGEREKNIAAMAEWVRNYRATLSPAEKESLRARLRTEAGQAMLKRAAAQYLSQDIHYRTRTVPVIKELMTTVAAVQTP